jgi:hypothetical protein
MKGKKNLIKNSHIKNNMKKSELRSLIREAIKKNKKLNEGGIEPSSSGWYLVVKVGFNQWGEFGEVESFITKSPEKYTDVVDPDFPDPVYEITPIEVK